MATWPAAIVPLCTTPNPLGITAASLTSVTWKLYGTGLLLFPETTSKYVPVDGQGRREIDRDILVRSLNDFVTRTVERPIGASRGEAMEQQPLAGGAADLVDRARKCRG